MYVNNGSIQANQCTERLQNMYSVQVTSLSFYFSEHCTLQWGESLKVV